MLEATGIVPDAPGVVTADSADATVQGVADLLAGHRAWDRFTPSV